MRVRPGLAVALLAWGLSGSLVALAAPGEEPAGQETTVPAREPKPEVQVLLGLGYRSESGSPVVLTGARLERQRSDWQAALQVANLVAPGNSPNSLVLGIEGEGQGAVLPLYRWGLGGAAFWRHAGGCGAWSLGLHGQGAVGRVLGEVRVRYEEPGPWLLPWDLMSGQWLTEALREPGLQLEARMTARVGGTWRWVQGVAWRRRWEAEAASVMLTGGPLLPLAGSELELQGGVLLAPKQIKSLGRVAYRAKEGGPMPGSWSLTVTAGLEEGPLWQAAYQVKVGRWRLSGLAVLAKAGGQGRPVLYLLVEPQL